MESHIIANKTEILESLNNYFTCITHHDTLNISRNSDTVFLNPVTEEDICIAVKSLKKSPSVGHDAISVRLLGVTTI